MSRATSNSRRAGLALLAAAAMLTAGCGEEYAHRRMRKDSPRAAQVAEMLQRLRAGGAEGLEEAVRRDGAAGLEPKRREALLAALRQVVEADEAELERVDEFGRNVYRATIRLTAGGEQKTVAMLLVVPEGESGERLCWAGRN